MFVGQPVLSSQRAKHVPPTNSHWLGNLYLTQVMQASNFVSCVLASRSLELGTRCIPLEKQYNLVQHCASLATVESVVNNNWVYQSNVVLLSATDLYFRV